jgi:hypothetical protein
MLLYPSISTSNDFEINYNFHGIAEILLKVALKSLTWFLIWHLKLIENGGVTHNFESGPPKDHFNSNFWATDFDVISILAVHVFQTIHIPVNWSSASLDVIEFFMPVNRSCTWQYVGSTSSLVLINKMAVIWKYSWMHTVDNPYVYL